MRRDGWSQEPPGSAEHRGGEVDRQPLRVMTYSIRAGLGAHGEWSELCSRRHRLDSIADLIAAESPDLVALQELVVLDFGDEIMDQAAYLAHRLGHHYAFGLVRAFPARHDGAIVGQGQWGNAVLTRHPIRGARAHPLTNVDGDEPRALLETRIDVDGATLTFASAHLSFYPSETARQTADVAELLRPALSGRAVLAGDFNTTPGSAPLRPLAGTVLDTFSAAGFNACDSYRWSFPHGSARAKAIDHVFVTPDFVIGDCRVCVDESGASDHNPVIVQLELPG